VRPELRAFDDVGVAQFLAFGSTVDGVTLFRGLRLLPGATLLRHRRGTAPVRSQYFRPSDWECLEGLTEDEFESRFTETFSGLLPEYLQGEQPVGISLTGGLDTRMIVAALPKNQRPAVAYTYAAQGGDRLLDLTIARRVAQMRGIPHHALRVDHAFLGDYGRLLDRSVYVTDGCSGALGAHELFLSERARELAPVRLTGNFGSEVLRSMSTFKRNGPGDELLDRAVAGAVAEVVAEQSERRPHPVTHAAFREVPWHLYAAPAAGRSQLSIRTPFMDNRIVELAYRAPAPSRQSVMPCLRMIHACDPALSRIPTDRGVSWGGFGVAQRLRRLWASATFKLDYWHKDGLPDALSRFDGALSSLSHLGWLGQHKYLAYRVWFRESLAAHARQVIGDARTRSLPFWNREALDSIMPDHTSGRRNRLRDIHSVLTLEAVHRQLIDGSAFAQPSRTTSQGEQPCPTL
jgi:asparagine synthase (glutamine-hydrolysing)